MHSKKAARLRRAKKTRRKSLELRTNRLSVFRSPKHLYAQIIDISGNVLASVSTLDKAFKELPEDIRKANKTAIAAKVGELLATKAKELKIENVVFDRSGYQYHGRIKALADSAREHGMLF